MGKGNGRGLVLGLASEDGMGRDSGLVVVKAPVASFGVRWGQVGMGRLGTADRGPSGLCVRAGQGIILLFFLEEAGRGPGRA